MNKMYIGKFYLWTLALACFCTSAFSQKNTTIPKDSAKQQKIKYHVSFYRDYLLKEGTVNYYITPTKLINPKADDVPYFVLSALTDNFGVCNYFSDSLFIRRYCCPSKPNGTSALNDPQLIRFVFDFSWEDISDNFTIIPKSIGIFDKPDESDCGEEHWTFISTDSLQEKPFENDNYTIGLSITMPFLKYNETIIEDDRFISLRAKIRSLVKKGILTTDYLRGAWASFKSIDENENKDLCIALFFQLFYNKKTKKFSTTVTHIRIKDIRDGAGEFVGKIKSGLLD